MFVQCHIEETDQYGNTTEDKSTQCVGRSLQEEDAEQGMVANGSRNTRAISGRDSKKNDQQPTVDEVEDLLEDAEKKWALAKKVWAEYGAETDADKKEKKRISTENLEDMSNSAMKKYSEAKSQLRKSRGIDGDIIPIDNVMHSMWSGIDITMNGVLVSTMNQKYMYKSYFETILNNSSSTKKYQLKTSGYFGDRRK